MNDDGFDVFCLEALPEGWRLATLQSLTTNSFGGGTPSTRVSEYWDGDIPWTTSAVLQSGEVYLRSYQRMITRRGLDESSSQLVPKGSVLVGTRVGVGKSVVTTSEIAISQDLTALVPKEYVSSEFLALALKVPTVRRWFDDNKRGTTIKGVSRTDVLRLMIPLPPRPEQDAISSSLLHIRRSQEACEQVIAATQQLKASLHQHLFTYGPMGLDQADDVHLTENPMGLFPDDWKSSTLGHLCSTGQGAIQTGPFGSQLHKSDYADEGVPVVNPTHLFGNRINHEKLPFISPAKAQQLARHRLRRGDVLFARRGEIGRHGLVGAIEEGWQCGTGCFLLRVDHPDIFNAYLPWYFSLRPTVEWLVSNAAGAIMPNLTGAALARLPVFYPPLEQQEEIVRVLSTLDAKIKAETHRGRVLAQVFRSMLHGFINGTIRLREFVTNR